MAASAGPITWENAAPWEADLVGMVVCYAKSFEDGPGKDAKTRFDRFFNQYRGFNQLKSDLQHGQGRRDRDAIILDARKRWGAQLHIPASFRTIESMVPRAIANMPRILVSARGEQWVPNVPNVKMLLDAQQDQIDIDLTLQAVMRSGHINGLGASKSYWLTKYGRRRRQERQVRDSKSFILSDGEPVKVFDDPMCEDIDIYDLMWDRYGSNVETCEWMIHRKWLSAKGIRERVEQQVWNTESAGKLTAELIDGLGDSKARYDEAWRARLEASGFHTSGTDEDRPHELLEWHDGEKVCTILDRQILVQTGESVAGEKPFQIYRPTPLQKQFVGIGSLEPIEHLQRELDTLRSQRRDAATMALAPGYAYDEDAIDRNDLVFGPNFAIPVRNMPPRDALLPILTKDVPGAGYQEEAAINANIEAVTGETDALNNTPASRETTATEATLVQAALGARIELSSRRFEIEVVRNVGRQFLYMDQRMIGEQRDALVRPGSGLTAEEAHETGEWRKFPIGPGELEGDFEIAIEGGSMAAKNIPQERQDANFLLQNLAQNWYVNPEKVVLEAMRKYSIEHPEAWLRSPEPPVPMAALAFLLEAGVPEALMATAIQRGREVAAPEEGAEQHVEMAEQG